VRIEDLIAITDNGVEVLTHSPKDLNAWCELQVEDI
jgi:Xaa-Pro aminopeptidase